MYYREELMNQLKKLITILNDLLERKKGSLIQN